MLYLALLGGALIGLCVGVAITALLALAVRGLWAWAVPTQRTLAAEYGLVRRG